MNGLDSASAGAAREAERAKKIYRYVSDTARRLDEVAPACKTTADLFTTYMEGLRQKLRDNCEKLIFTDPLAYGRKAIELLWRKAYYETVSTAKKLRIKDDEHDNYIYMHIVCGIGHYHHIISRIITEMDVKIASLDYPPMPWDDDGKETNVKVDEDIRQWGSGIIHTCFIYLGDLSRYQSEMFDNFDSSIAARYYLQAACLDISSGMPYNQLGNLYTDRNHNLDSVSYYIHCLSCAVPFEGAEGNLARLFEKNAQYVETIAIDDVENMPPNERVKLTIARVLTLAENWFTGKENVDIAQLCNFTAHDLKVCLSYEEPTLPDVTKNYAEHVQTKEVETVYPSYLNNDIIYKIVKICLFCINKLSENDSNKAFAVKAFTLALFSQLLQKFLDQMHKYGFQSPSRNRRPSLHKSSREIPDVKDDIKAPTNGITEEIAEKEKSEDKVKVNGFTEEHDEHEMVNGNAKSNGKKTLAKRRRRRRANFSESSEESDDWESSSTESDSSSDDSSHSDDSCSEDSDEEAKKETKIDEIKNNISEREKFTNIPKEKPIPAVTKIDETAIQNFLRGDNFLPSLKLLQDWVLTETDLILSCGESGDTLFQSVVDMLNILQKNFTKKLSNKDEVSSKMLNYARNAAAKLELEFKSIPLPEDVNLRGTDICKFDKDSVEWDLLKRYNPSVYEENIIRILNFVSFGHQIANIIPRIRYNRTMQIFFMKKNHNAKPAAKAVRKESKKKLQRSPAKGHAPRHTHGGDTSLMRNLGKLWLQSQVRELESAVRAGGGGRETLPAYLVVDTDALTHHTKLVKQLVKARKFVVLVPSVVLQSIDELKKEQGGARDAIRWLETQLQTGSRFLRTQRPNETRPLPLVKYPRKAPKQVHQFIQIIEFCHHFIAKDVEIGDGDTVPKPTEKKGPAMLVLLTGNLLSEIADDQKDFSYTGLAQSAGVSVDCIVHFFTKWRHLLCKPGNKR